MIQDVIDSDDCLSNPAHRCIHEIWLANSIVKAMSDAKTEKRQFHLCSWISPAEAKRDSLIFIIAHKLKLIQVIRDNDLHIQDRVAKIIDNLKLMPCLLRGARLPMVGPRKLGLEGPLRAAFVASSPSIIALGMTSSTSPSVMLLLLCLLKSNLIPALLALINIFDIHLY